MKSDFKSVTDVVAVHVLVRLFMNRHAAENAPSVGEHQSDNVVSFEDEIEGKPVSETIIPEENRRGKAEFKTEDGWELSNWLRAYFNT